MADRIAIIDLGTNTFHLLIADIDKKAYRIIYRVREAVKLGMLGINQGLITNEAMDRAIKTIARFQSSINHYEVMPDKVFAFGTSALRNANNKADILLRIKEAAGISVNVISGEEEARLIYLGVKSAIPLGLEKSLIIDIGGGSVEFIIGNHHEIFWKRSFELGAQRLLEKFHNHDPILKKEIENLNSHVESELTPLFEKLGLYQPKTLIGVSGTFDTLSDIHCLQQNMVKTKYAPETPLTLSSFREIHHELLAKNRKERMMIPGMIEMRVDMIVVACCLIDLVLAKFQFDTVRVSSYALKEGVLTEIFNNRQA